MITATSASRRRPVAQLNARAFAVLRQGCSRKLGGKDFCRAGEADGTPAQSPRFTRNRRAVFMAKTCSVGIVMDENLRTWVWFISVIMGMTLGPILICSVVIYGIVNFCRHHRGVIGKKLRAARIFHDGH